MDQLDQDASEDDLVAVYFLHGEAPVVIAAACLSVGVEAAASVHYFDAGDDFDRYQAEQDQLWSVIIAKALMQQAGAEGNPPRDWSGATSKEVAKHIRGRKDSVKLAAKILVLAKQGLSAHHISLRATDIAKSTAHGVIATTKRDCPGFLP